jgi:hypothetical protein
VLRGLLHRKQLDANRRMSCALQDLRDTEQKLVWSFPLKEYNTSGIQYDFFSVHLGLYAEIRKGIQSAWRACDKKGQFVAVLNIQKLSDFALLFR